MKQLKRRQNKSVFWDSIIDMIRLADAESYLVNGNENQSKPMTRKEVSACGDI